MAASEIFARPLEKGMPHFALSGPGTVFDLDQQLGLDSNASLLRPTLAEKRETANRVRGRIGTIIAKNVDVDDSDFRNPAELTKQVREKLPRCPRHVVRHHPALPYAEAPQFMAHLSAAGGIAASMLRFKKGVERTTANLARFGRDTGG